MPPSRSVTYHCQIDLPNSPSSTMSIPTSTCRRTTSATAVRQLLLGGLAEQRRLRLRRALQRADVRREDPRHRTSSHRLPGDDARAGRVPRRQTAGDWLPCGVKQPAARRRFNQLCASAKTTRGRQELARLAAPGFPRGHHAACLRLTPSTGLHVVPDPMLAWPTAPGSDKEEWSNESNCTRWMATEVHRRVRRAGCLGRGRRQLCRDAEQERHQLHRLRRGQGRKGQPQALADQDRLHEPGGRADRDRQDRRQRRRRSRSVHQRAGGGIGGHPVVLVKCFIARPRKRASSAARSSRTTRTSSPSSQGAVAIGSESLYAASQGRSRSIVGVSVNPVDVVRPNAAILFGDSQYILAPYATFARDMLQVQVGLAHLPRGRRARQRRRQVRPPRSRRPGSRSRRCPIPANTADLSVPLIGGGARRTPIW